MFLLRSVKRTWIKSIKNHQLLLFFSTAFIIILISQCTFLQVLLLAKLVNFEVGSILAILSQCLLMSTLTLDYWQKYWNYFAPTYIASIEKEGK